jgi:hypothetical protein
MERLPQYYRCGECEMAPASVDCRDCSESYCADCYQTVHAKGKRAAHENNRRIFVCQRCSAAPAVFACGDDGKVYCDRCNTRLHGPKGKHRKNAASVKPVAEYFATAGGKAPAVDKDEENGLGLKVNALVASPARFSRTAAAVADTMHDVEAAAEEPGDGRVEGGAAGESDPLSADKPDDEGGKATRPEAAVPAVKFIDSETEKLLVGSDIVAERVWGWRRLCRLFPEGAIFETGNKSLRTKCACSTPDFPDVRDPTVAEATGQAPGAEDVGVHKQVESLPRFPHRPASIALDERGLNLAVLAVALAGSSAPLARLFHSFEHRQTGYYSLQFFEPFTRAERIRNAAASAGMPLTEQSPARQRGAADVSEPRSTRGPYKVDAEALSPRRQHEALVNETGAGGVPTLAFLRDVFDKVSVPVAVDDLVPTGKDGRPIFGLTDQAGELWRLILGKGFAKYSGSYAALEHANPVEAVRTLTGARVTAESWGGCVECLNLFPDLEAAARFVWWRVDAARRLGQLCWFTHSREAVVDGNDGYGAAGDGEFSPDRFRDLDEAEAAAADDAAVDAPEEAVVPPEPVVAEAAPSEPPQHAALEHTPVDAVLPTAAAIGDEPNPFSLPAEWGSTAWATRQGANAEVVDAAVAIHTAEMSLRAANNAGIRRDTLAAPPSADGWQLVKLNQLGGDLGAERFSYAHFSGQWTKELRERFDFKASDSDIVMGTAEDLAESFDTVTCCSGYVGAPPSVNFVLRPQQSAAVRAESASRMLVVLRPGVVQLSVTNAAAFDLRRARPVPATTALQLALHSVSAASGESFLSLPTSFDTPNAVANAVAVPPVMAVNVALGLSDRVPDQFLVRGLSGEPAPEGSDIGLAFVLTVAQSYHTDALSVVLGFKHGEVAFVRLLDDDQ